MLDRIEKDSFDIIRTPDQMLAEAISCRQELLNGELKTQSYFVRDIDGWKVIYSEDGGYEENTARDDDVVALLRLAEGVVSLNKKPIQPNHEPISLESFFKKSILDKENFGSLHTQMNYDPLLKCTVLAQLEDIFELPAEEKVYTGIRNEFLGMPELENEYNDLHVTKNDIHESDRSRRKGAKIATVLSLGAAATLTIAACGVISSDSDNSKDTLVPLMNPDTTTTVETTIVEIPCGEVTIVNEGESLTQIANRCDKTLEQIALWNNIENVNLIRVGQVLRLSEPEINTESSTVDPETTTTTTTTTIVALPEVATTETLNVIPSTTIVIPETTLPPQNDGVLTETQCIELGGFQHRFQFGEYLYNALQDIYGIQENQASALLKTPIIAKYRLEQITASTPGQKGAECMPDKSEILPYLPKPIFKTTTSTP